MLKSLDDIHGLSAFPSRPICKSSSNTDNTDNSNNKSKHSLYCQLFSGQKQTNAGVGSRMEPDKQVKRRENDTAHYSNFIERGPITTLLPVPQYNMVLGKSLALISASQEGKDEFDPELERLIERFTINIRIQLVLNSILSFLLQYVWSIRLQTSSSKQSRLRSRERKLNATESADSNGSPVEPNVKLDDIAFWKEKNRELNDAFNDCSSYAWNPQNQTNKHPLSYSYLFDVDAKATKAETKRPEQNHTFFKGVGKGNDKGTYCKTIDGFSLKNAYNPSDDSSSNAAEFHVREIVQQQISVWLDLVEDNHFLLLAISRLMNFDEFNPVLKTPNQQQQQQRNAIALSFDVSLTPVADALQSIQNTIRMQQQQQQSCLISS